MNDGPPVLSFQKDGYPYWLKGMAGFESCTWPCAVCGRETTNLIQVQLARPCPEYGPDADVLRTELVCSEGCAIRFVDAGAPDSWTHWTPAESPTHP